MFNKETLKEIGMSGLNADQEKQILDQLNETLQMRVGTKLTAQLSDEQLVEFEKVVEKQGDDAAQKWVEANVADYKTIVSGEAELMLNDIKELNKATQDEIAKQQ